MPHTKFKAIGNSTLTPVDNKKRKEVFVAAHSLNHMPKKVTKVYWSYGSTETRLNTVSRFYVDLNIHVETENYDAGESVVVQIECDDDADGSTSQEKFSVSITVDASGYGCIRDVFSDKQVELYGKI